MRKKEHPTYGRQKSKRECHNSATPWLFLIVIVVIIIFILIPFFRGRMLGDQKLHLRPVMPPKRKDPIAQ